jgi:hypothetical protein
MGVAGLTVRNQHQREEAPMNDSTISSPRQPLSRPLLSAEEAYPARHLALLALFGKNPRSRRRNCKRRG